LNIDIYKELSFLLIIILKSAN